MGLEPEGGVGEERILSEDKFYPIALLFALGVDK